ncbi:MAG: ribosomal protein S18-alanine N-acetyltransferase [Succinivibrionaceae bacterium]
MKSLINYSDFTINQILKSDANKYIDLLVEIESISHIHPWTKKELYSSFGDRYTFFGLFKSNEIIGYAIYDCVLDIATIQNICIHPKYQGIGLGSLLLSTTFELIQKKLNLNVINVLLEVRISNKIAINLYKKHGFKEDGIRKNYYPTSIGKEDALLMSKIIQG